MASISMGVIYSFSEMPTTQFSDTSLSFAPPAWSNNSSQRQNNYNSLTTGNASSPGSSSSASSISSSYHENSSSPLRSPDTTTEDVPVDDRPYLQILEQPYDKFRFRYITEMQGTHGAILGAKSHGKSRAKSYPRVKLCNYKAAREGAEVIIRCSLYTADQDEAQRVAHVHRLVGKRGGVESDDPHDISVRAPHYTANFQQLTILYTKKEKQLGTLVEKKQTHTKRKLTDARSVNLRMVNPHELKAIAEKELSNMDLNVTTLRFDALVDNGKGLYTAICPPVYSTPISNMKNAHHNDLRISRISRTVGLCDGRQEVMIFVEKVVKDNIKVKFYEEGENKEIVWSADADFSPDDVHHQYGIVFKTPPYRDLDIQENRVVFFQLVRPTDMAVSEPRVFEYTPNLDRLRDLGRKRPRLNDSYMYPTTLQDFQTSSSKSVLTSAPAPPIVSTSTDIDFSKFNLDPFENLDIMLLDEIMQPEPADYESVSSMVSSNPSLTQYLDRLPSADQKSISQICSFDRFDEYVRLQVDGDGLNRSSDLQVDGCIKYSGSKESNSGRFDTRDHMSSHFKIPRFNQGMIDLAHVSPIAREEGAEESEEHSNSCWNGMKTKEVMLGAGFNLPESHKNQDNIPKLSRPVSSDSLTGMRFLPQMGNEAITWPKVTEATFQMALGPEMDSIKKPIYHESQFHYAKPEGAGVIRFQMDSGQETDSIKKHKDHEGNSQGQVHYAEHQSPRVPSVVRFQMDSGQEIDSIKKPEDHGGSCQDQGHHATHQCDFGPIFAGQNVDKCRYPRNPPPSQILSQRKAHQPRGSFSHLKNHVVTSSKVGPTGIRRRLELNQHNIAVSINQTLDSLLQRFPAKLASDPTDNERFQKCLRRLFSYCVGDNEDSVFHVLASSESISPYLEKFITTLKQNNISDPIINYRNKKQETALHVAVRLGCVETVASLVDAGADVDLTDSNNNSASHLAVLRQTSALPLLEVLLRKRPNLSTHNADGLTALHMAVTLRRSDIISTLLIKAEEDGFPPDIINHQDRKNGNTALHFAVQNRFKEVVNLLLNFEDQINVNVKNFAEKTPLAFVYGEVDPDSREIQQQLLLNKADPKLVQSKIEEKKMECKNEWSSESEAEIIDTVDVDDGISAYAREWGELELFDIKTINKLCPLLDEKDDWLSIVKKFDYSDSEIDCCAIFWSPTLFAFRLAALKKPSVTAEAVRDQLLTMSPRLQRGAQYIDDMILHKMGLD